MKTKVKLLDRLNKTIDFTQKKCVIYQRMVKDLSLKLDFELPEDQTILSKLIESKQFKEVPKNLYSENEKRAAGDLYSQLTAIISDPYLMYEVCKIFKVNTRSLNIYPETFTEQQKSQYQTQNIGRTLNSIKP